MNRRRTETVLEFRAMKTISQWKVGKWASAIGAKVEQSTWNSRSLSPRPSPPGRGRIFSSAGECSTVGDSSRRGHWWFPLLGERARVRILRKHFSRLEPLNRQRQVGLGVLTPPRPSGVSSLLGGGVRTPSPTFRFVGSLHLQLSDAHWDHEPKAPASRTHSKRFASLRSVETARQRLECVELAPAFWGWFM